MVKNTRATLRAVAQGFLARKINFLGIPVIPPGPLTEIKLRRIFGIKPDDGVERPSHLVAEPGERANFALGK